MFQHIQRILLLCAWGLLFTHSIVPHAHEAEAQLAVCASEHEHEEDLWDVLGHIFHFSTGIDHLEDYSPGNTPIVLFICEVLKVSPPLLVVQVATFNSPKIYFSEAHQRYRPLRAPPVYS